MSTPKKILCVDIEATCWDGRPPNLYPEQRNEIIEIGITELSVAKSSPDGLREILRSEGILVKPPTTEISEFCTKLTTITPEMIEKDGLTFHAALDHMDKTYKPKNNIWASWGDYDRKSFEKNCAWNKTGYPFSNLHINVKALFAAHYGWNGGLDKCAGHLGLPFQGTHHRGVDDSRMVARVLRLLLRY